MRRRDQRQGCLAAALAQRGHDVVALDADTTAANLHLVLGAESVELTAQREPLELLLPSASGVRLATPVSFPDRRHFRATELVSTVRFARWPTHVVVDLPGGWSDDHDAIASLLPDAVVCVLAPTATAAADHTTHVATWQHAWQTTTAKVRESDKRRKWAELPEDVTILEVETMARFRGVDEASGAEVTIRRSDALSSDELAAHAQVVASMPATASVSELAQSPEMKVLIDAIERLEPRPAD